MQVEMQEMGERPRVVTAARMFAPQAMRKVADLLRQEQWADKAFVYLDWSDVLDLQPEGAPVIPVLIAQVVKSFPGRGALRTEYRLDVDDAFGKDQMTADILLDMVRGLQESIEEGERTHDCGD